MLCKTFAIFKESTPCSQHGISYLSKLRPPGIEVEWWQWAGPRECPIAAPTHLAFLNAFLLVPPPPRPSHVLYIYKHINPLLLLLHPSECDL